tara:strand:- start:16084 stop:18153 length:2070 start_codon:yes stop_codon:yes gene_type:complete
MKSKEIKLSSEFKAQASKSIFAIFLFVLIYFVLLASSILLTILCVYFGIELIRLHPSLITLIAGLGLGSIGVFLLVFLIKFLFKSHKVERSHFLEIHKEDEPKLFGMIEEIVQSVGTQFPKKVYLSPDVNAGVFYDSSFWSMFLPIRKNLNIGLGLVNTITEQELKSILSHEFGHFSQSSMKLGSYVYNVNQIIFNLLYNNQSYDKMLMAWANANGFLGFFVAFTSHLVSLIKYILEKMYGIVNTSYMALSREMEFHADEIAASITGYAPLKDSLLRMSLSTHAFQEVLGFYENKISSNLKSTNLYLEHSFILNFLAHKSGLAYNNELPVVSLEEMGKFNKSKLVIQDQWASHPTEAERIKMLEKTGFEGSETKSNPANSLFSNIEKSQLELSDIIFKGIEFKGEVKQLSFENFKKEYEKFFKANTFSDIYNGYFDQKNPIIFDIEKFKKPNSSQNIKDLFSEEKLDLAYTSLALEGDIETLKQISKKDFPIKSFDYSGRKYKKKESSKLIPGLEKELKEINKALEQNDIDIYNFFLAFEQEPHLSTKLDLYYSKFFKNEKEYEENFKLYERLGEALQFISEVTPFEEIRVKFKHLKSLEIKLKAALLEFLKDENFQAEINAEIRENLEQYTSKEWSYFGRESYFDSSLEVLFTAVNNYMFLISRKYFVLKKRVLDYQEELYHESLKRI